MKTGFGREGSYFSVNLDEFRALASLLPTVEHECLLLDKLNDRHPSVSAGQSMDTSGGSFGGGGNSYGGGGFSQGQRAGGRGGYYY